MSTTDMSGHTEGISHDDKRYGATVDVICLKVVRISEYKTILIFNCQNDCHGLPQITYIKVEL